MLLAGAQDLTQLATHTVAGHGVARRPPDRERDSRGFLTGAL
jgi:hypothetical protein